MADSTSSFSEALFYRDPVPLEARQHDNVSLRADFGFSFAAKVNAVPINMIEIPHVQRFYPIAFSPSGATPVAVLGLREDENLFVDAGSRWRSGVYIPAYVRRYPFIFAQGPAKDELMLCVDMGGDAVVEGRSNPFFERDGTPSPLSQRALAFCSSYNAAAQQTLEFSRCLEDLELLVPRAVEFRLGASTLRFSGIAALDEERFQALPDDAFLELRRRGLLRFLDAVLLSHDAWGSLAELLGERMGEAEGGKTSRAHRAGTGEESAAATPRDLAESEDRFFADRLAARAHFDDTAAAARSGRLVASAYWGVHGVGKSRFFRELRKQCRATGDRFHLASYQFPRQGSPTSLEVLDALANGLSRDHSVKPRRYTLGRQILMAARRSSAEEFKLLRSDRELKLGRGSEALSAGVEALPAGSILTYLGEKTIGLVRAFQENRDAYREEVEQMLRDASGELLEANDIEHRLARLLARDLNDAYGGSEDPLLVILLDEYERVWPSADAVHENSLMPIDEAVRDLCAGLDRGVLAVFTREVPAWEKDPRLAGRLAESWAYQLELFGDEDSLSFLRRYVPEEEIAEAMVANAKGHPGWLNLQLDQYQQIVKAGREPTLADFLVDSTAYDSIGDALVGNMLRDHRPEYRRLFEALSGLRSFDRHMFEAAVRRLNLPLGPDSYRSLGELSFVEPADATLGTLRIRDHVAEVLRRRAKPELLPEVQALAVEHFDARSVAAGEEGRHDDRNRFILESLYYRCRLDPAAAQEWVIDRVRELAGELRYAYAIDLADSALTLLLQAGDTDALRIELELVRTLRLAGFITRARQQAEATYQRALTTRIGYLIFRAAQEMAETLVALGALEEAESLLQVLERSFSSLAGSAEGEAAGLAALRYGRDSTMARVYEAVGRYSLGEALAARRLRRSQDSAEPQGDGGLSRINWLRQSGAIHHRRGDLEQAARRLALACVLAAPDGSFPQWAAACRLSLASIEVDRGGTKVAERALAEARRIFAKVLSPEDPFHSLADAVAGALAARDGRAAEGERKMADARRALLHRFGFGSGLVSRVARWQAESLLSRGQVPNAVALLRQEVRRLQGQLAGGHPGLAELLPVLIRAAEQGGAASAVAALSRWAEESRSLLVDRGLLRTRFGTEIEPALAGRADLDERLAAVLADPADLSRLARRYVEPAFYPGSLLVVLAYPETIPCELYALDLGDEVEVLDFSRELLAELNQRALRLDDANVADYVRFVLACDRLASRSPVLVESLDDLPPEVEVRAEARGTLEQELFALKLLRGGSGGSWLLRGCVLQDGDLAAVDIRVQAQGELTFGHRSPLHRGLAARGTRLPPDVLDGLLPAGGDPAPFLAPTDPETIPGRRPSHLLPGPWEEVSLEEARSLVEQVLGSDRAIEDAVISASASLLAVERLPLASLDGALYQLNLLFEGSVAALDLVMAADGWKILDGTSRPFFELWRKGRVDTGADEHLAEYTRLFCCALRGGEGRFEVVEGTGDLRLRDGVRHLELPIEPWRSTREDDGRLLHSATILYNSALFRSQMRLDLGHGGVNMDDDTPLAQRLPVIHESFQGSFRLLEGSDGRKVLPP